MSSSSSTDTCPNCGSAFISRLGLGDYAWFLCGTEVKVYPDGSYGHESLSNACPEIARLRAENKRLRGALDGIEDVASGPFDGTEGYDSFTLAFVIGAIRRLRGGDHA